MQLRFNLGGWSHKLKTPAHPRVLYIQIVEFTKKYTIFLECKPDALRQDRDILYTHQTRANGFILQGKNNSRDQTSGHLSITRAESVMVINDGWLVTDLIKDADKNDHRTRYIQSEKILMWHATAPQRQQNPFPWKTPPSASRYSTWKSQVN